MQGTYNTVCVNCRNRESKVRQTCGHGVCHGNAETAHSNRISKIFIIVFQPVHCICTKESGWK